MSEKSASHQRPPRTRLSRRVHLGLVVGGIIAVATGLLLISIPSNSASFGWFDYQPLPETASLPSVVFSDPVHQVGLVVGIVGVALLAFSAGWTFGRREAVARSSE